jgi:hypothetical protein
MHFHGGETSAYSHFGHLGGCAFFGYTIPSIPRTRARARLFHGAFYGRRIFCCKTAQFHEMQRESDSFRLPMKNKLRNAAKTYATR